MTVPLARTADLIAAAVASATAVPAFNVITLEHAQGIADGVAQAAAQAGVVAEVGAILQVSENAVRYHSGRLGPIVAACREVASDASMPLSVHLDHVTSTELSGEAIERAEPLGVSSLMFDAAHLDFMANVYVTADVVRTAHRAGLFVEGELGEVGGKGGAHAPGVRTEPTQAISFIEATAVDALAVAVGSTHAMTERTASLDLDLISRLADACRVPLVLHGSSGVPDEVLSAAVRRGMRKINIGTLLNVALTDAARAALSDPALTDPRKYLGPARTAVADAVQHICRVVTVSPRGEES